MQIPSGQYVLDVGVGTASALANNKALLVSKNISVVGLDYEQAYITKAAAVVQKAGLADRVAVICKSVYDEDLHAAADAANNAKGGKGEAKGEATGEAKGEAKGEATGETKGDVKGDVRARRRARLMARLKAKRHLPPLLPPPPRAGALRGASAASGVRPCGPRPPTCGASSRLCGTCCGRGG